MRYRISKYKHLHSNRFRYLSSSIPLVCASGLLVIGGLLLFPLQASSVRAEEDPAIEDNSEDYGIDMLALNPTLEMSIGGAGMDEVVDARTNQVAYRAHTVTVASTDVKSYTLAISGPVGLDSPDGTTVISGAANATPSTMADNTWGFAYGQSVDKTNMQYSSFTGTEQIIDSGNTAPNFTKNLVFAAKFGDNAKVGHYTASVVLSVVAEAKTITNYSINYDANGGTNPPAATTYEDESDGVSYTMTLSSSQPTRSGHEFAGWATSANGGVVYQPGGTVTLQDTSPTLTLYAIWSQQYTYTITYNANNGSNAPGAQTITTTAESHEFTVAAQGSMTRSGYTFLGWSEDPSASSATYTAGSSKITLTKTSPTKTLYAAWERNKTLTDITNMNQLTTQICKNTSNGTSKALTDTSSGGDNKSYTVTKLKDGNCWMTTNMNNSTGRAYEDSMYGGYYTNEGSGSSNGETISGSDTTSVCAHMGGGWVLPSKDQYVTLASGLTVTAITGSPYNFQKGGYVNSGHLNEAGSRGWYWSSTANNSDRAYYLRFDSSSVFPSDTNLRYFGFSVRCLVSGS